MSPFVVLGFSGEYFLLFLYFAYKFLQAYSVNPDQPPLVAACELDVHCLHIPPPRMGIWLKRVGMFEYTSIFFLLFLKTEQL